MFDGMEPVRTAMRVEVGHAPDGTVMHLVPCPPELLPPVRGRDLELAWEAARQAALSARFGAPRVFRFRRADGSTADLALADRDARCWADAADRVAGMDSAYGLSLCLRLLALVDLLAGACWASRALRFARDGADLHPSLLRAAAIMPLTAEARFEEASFRAHLPAFIPDPPPALARLTGASA
jgi:hypothetical protein